MVSSLSLVRFDNEIITNGQPPVISLHTFLLTQESMAASEPQAGGEMVSQELENSGLLQ